MLTNSFLHVPGVCERRERELWQSGARDWDAFERKEKAGSLPESFTPSLRARVATELKASRKALDGGDFVYFGKRLPAREHWRAAKEFGERTAFFDIETTGLSPVDDDLTVCGVYDGKGVRSFVRGQNLDQLPNQLNEHAVLVSFNGARFDLPFIQHAFPSWRSVALHVDLCRELHELGEWGGLKQIEKRFGLARSADTDGMTGMDAVYLWEKYARAQDEQALKKLLAYNAEDVRNLEPLLQHAYERKRARCLDEADG